MRMSTSLASHSVPVRRGAYLQLLLATTGFGLNFWAWALIGPLGPAYKTALDLTSFQQALVVALPVLVGSLGRIPVGALTDRFGARVMFPVISFLTIFPLLFLGFFGESLSQLLIGGFFLGLGGTTFAIGIPMVNGWFPPERRGLALGIFGAGMGGTAISAFTTVKLAQAHSRSFPFFLLAVILGLYGLIALLLVRDAKALSKSSNGFWRRTWTTMRMGVTLRLSALYAVGFGGFVAFSVYLVTYLKNAYGLTQVDAASRTAGFVVLAVIARPVGGWLSDKFHPIPVLATSFTLITILAGVASFHLELVPLATGAFLGMAVGLGAAAGACFALVAIISPAQSVGSITGVVGAAGGLGGFVPPLVMGSIYGSTGSYTIGFVLLSVVALTAASYTWFAMRGEAR
jgi:NNP family nitrate/nitrite transporter-like MFS transporter